MSEAQALWAVVPAAGKGARMGSEVPKQYLRLRGRPVIAHTLARLLQNDRLQRIAVAIAADDQRIAGVVGEFSPQVFTVQGGAERRDSVLAGLHALSAFADAEDWVLVHDAARPCVRAEDIDAMLDALGDSRDGGLLGVPARDTLKQCDPQGTVAATLDRNSIWHAFTPQMFRLGQLRAALEHSLARGIPVTDEAQAIELSGGQPRMITGAADNIKITRPQDLALAAAFMAAQENDV